VRRALRWVWGADEESSISHAGTLRKIGIGALLFPLVVWIAEGEPPPLDVVLWCIPSGVALVALANRRWGKVEHRPEVYEARPRPGETGTPFAIADCDCGWGADADTLDEALAAAREHSNTGDPVVRRDPV
jgi:hypothetical protein